MPSVRPVFLPLILQLSSLSFTHAFTFTYEPPTQCDPFTVSWTGGTAPFQLLLTPIFDNPRNISIPSSPSNGGYTLQQLPLSAGQQFIVTMSDATGFGTGGVSDILTVGSSISRVSCSTQIPTPSFQFELNSQLQQCSQYNISGYDAAVQPVTITGLIPLGTPLQLHSGTGPSWFLWNPVNVPAGTSLVFFLTDVENRFGGSSHVIQVAGSDNSGCLNAQSPRSTANSASGGPTAIGGATSTAGAPQATVTVSSGRISPAAIGGAVAGGLVALLMLGTLSTFFFRTYLPIIKRPGGSLHHFRASSSRHRPMPSVDLFQPNSGGILNQTPLNRFDVREAPPSQWTTFSPTSSNGHFATPYTVPPGTVEGYSVSPAENGPTDLALAGPSATKIALSSKSSAGPASRRPTRFVLHTDAEDEEIELPPQYVDRSGRSESNLSSS